jgi:hypothetical protein
MLAARVKQKNWGTKKKSGPKQRRSQAFDIAIDKGSAIQAVCGKAARTDLCGGREATRVPTAKAARVHRGAGRCGGVAGQASEMNWICVRAAQSQKQPAPWIHTF